MEFVKDKSSFSREAREQDEGRYVSGNTLLWVATIAVLLGLNFASWSFCMWVFGQPEYPMNYKILTKLEKLPPIHGFIATTAPRGKFHSAKDLYAKVYPFSDVELKAYNGILKRFYIKNYKERDDVVYLSGDFLVESVRRLTEDDVFPDGLVIRAKADKFPDAYIDLVLPGIFIPEDPCKAGDLLKVEESLACVAVLNIKRREDDVMIFTAVPLVADQKQPFVLGPEKLMVVSPPEHLQLDKRKWPVSDAPAIEEPAKPAEEKEAEKEDAPAKEKKS